MANTLGILVKNGNYAIEIEVEDLDGNTVDWSDFDFVAVAVHNHRSRTAIVKWTNKTPLPDGWKLAEIDGTDSTILDLILDDYNLDLAKEDSLEMDIMTYTADARFDDGYAKGAIVSNEEISVEVEGNSLSNIDLL